MVLYPFNNLRFNEIAEVLDSTGSWTLIVNRDNSISYFPAEISTSVTPLTVLVFNRKDLDSLLARYLDPKLKSYLKPDVRKELELMVCEIEEEIIEAIENKTHVFVQK
eukprot:Awhi_evm1s7052